VDDRPEDGMVCRPTDDDGKSGPKADSAPNDFLANSRRHERFSLFVIGYGSGLRFKALRQRRLPALLVNEGQAGAFGAKVPNSRH